MDDLITNPPRRGGPLCPPLRFGMEMGFIDVNPPLAGWMHRMCADFAGWYEKSDFESAVIFHPTNPLRRGGPLCPPACIDTERLNIDVNAALAGWMADPPGC